MGQYNEEPVTDPAGGNDERENVYIFQPLLTWV